jgi:hypothetical protein
MAAIETNSTKEYAMEAILKVKTSWVKHHDLHGSEYESLWCLEKVDVKGNRNAAVGRSSRPMINVKDNDTVNKAKNDARRKQGKQGGKRLRRSKNAKVDSDDLETYTKYLATHVMLYAEGRSLPSKGFHASHLCHNQRCMRPTHIRVESELLNQKRKGCLGFLMCTRCSKKWHTCTHHDTFKCINVTMFTCCGTNSQRIRAINLPQIKDEI